MRLHKKGFKGKNVSKVIKMYICILLIHFSGADINAQTEETQETALTLACCGGFLDVAEFLIKAGADIELGCR